MASEPAQQPAQGGPPSRPRGELREIARNRLIESRLTPNAISMTGLVLNLAAAGLILADMFVAGAFAFIVGSVMDTLDGRYSRMSGKGSLFGAFLDGLTEITRPGARVVLLVLKRGAFNRALATREAYALRHARIVELGGLWPAIVLLERRG